MSTSSKNLSQSNECEPVQVSNSLFFQGGKEQVFKWRGALRAHGYSLDLLIEIIMKLEYIIPDDDFKQIPDEILVGVVACS